MKSFQENVQRPCPHIQTILELASILDQREDEDELLMLITELNSAEILSATKKPTFLPFLGSQRSDRCPIFKIFPFPLRYLVLVALQKH